MSQFSSCDRWRLQDGAAGLREQVPYLNVTIWHSSSQYRSRRLLTRQQVSGVLVSVLVMSRSFGTRMNAMEVPLAHPLPRFRLYFSRLLSLMRGICRPSFEISRALLPSSTDSRAHPSRPAAPRRPLPPAAARRLPSLPALRYCLICAAAAQAFSVSFNASHLLPPLIDLMQDPVVNVRLKVAPAPAFHGSPTTSSRDAAGVRYGPRRLHNCSARLCGGCRGGVQARPRQGSSFMVPEPCPSLPALFLTSRLHAQLRRGQGQGSQRLCARHVQGSRSVVTFLLLFFV